MLLQGKEVVSYVNFTQNCADDHKLDLFIH
jgi:hypothetical protein